MNIKEHIEAGHYPRDDKGRALVPMADNRTAIILATDLNAANCIVGMVSDINNRYASVRHWTAWGDFAHAPGKHCNLLPPPPRKVIRWAALSHEQLDALGMYESDGPAQREVCGGKMLARIEYEVKW